ncbi:hypothetical protein CN163_34520, partial [Sinorhizobium meliloti]
MWSGRLLQERKSVMPLWSGASHVSGLCEAAHMAAGPDEGLSGILCGGPVSSVEEPLAKDDGELCLCLDPFP